MIIYVASHKTTMREKKIKYPIAIPQGIWYTIRVLRVHRQAEVGEPPEGQCKLGDRDETVW